MGERLQVAGTYKPGASSPAWPWALAPRAVGTDPVPTPGCCVGGGGELAAASSPALGQSMPWSVGPCGRNLLRGGEGGEGRARLTLL